MKKIHSIIIIVIILITGLMSCKKSSNPVAENYTCTTCKTTPDAIAANDNSSKGIYKGIIVGSTGTIKFDIDNNSSTITAEMVLDGTKVILTSIVQWSAGDAYIAPFKGTLNGQPVTINFNVGASGQTPTITSSDIPGHPNADFILIKESSSALIEAYEGTYTTNKPENGTLNVVLSIALKKWAVISKNSSTNSISHDDGTLVNNVFTDKNNQVIGTLNGDQFSGSFKDKDGALVTINGKRTL